MGNQVENVDALKAGSCDRHSSSVDLLTNICQLVSGVLGVAAILVGFFLSTEVSSIQAELSTARLEIENLTKLLAFNRNASTILEAKLASLSPRVELLNPEALNKSYMDLTAKSLELEDAYDAMEQQVKSVGNITEKVATIGKGHFSLFENYPRSLSFNTDPSAIFSLGYSPRIVSVSSFKHFEASDQYIVASTDASDTYRRFRISDSICCANPQFLRQENPYNMPFTLTGHVVPPSYVFAHFGYTTNDAAVVVQFKARARGLALVEYNAIKRIPSQSATFEFTLWQQRDGEENSTVKKQDTLIQGNSQIQPVKLELSVEHNDLLFLSATSLTPYSDGGVYLEFHVTIY